MTKTIHSPTADFLRNAIEATEKTQKEISGGAGLSHPNVLSMMKMGDCKVPINRIPKLARALGVDASDFIDIAMREYHAEIWMTLKGHYTPPLSEDEQKLIDIYRASTSVARIAWTTELEDALRGVFLLAATAERSTAG